MLIIYNETTGEVEDNTGTNNAMPLGPTGESVYANTDARGLSRAALSFLRLHDVEDATQVAAALTNMHHVDPATGALVIDGPYPSLTTDRESIPADGATPAVVTFESGRAPAEVAFDVNGTQVTEPVVEGRAQVEVVTTTAGPVVVTCEGLAVTIDATTEVPK